MISQHWKESRVSFIDVWGLRKKNHGRQNSERKKKTRDKKDSLGCANNWQIFAHAMKRSSYQQNARGQFHRHFWRQSRTAYLQIILMLFNGNNIGQKCTKMLCSVQKAQPKICYKNSAVVLVSNWTASLCHFLNASPFAHCANWLVKSMPGVKFHLQMGRSSVFLNNETIKKYN